MCRRGRLKKLSVKIIDSGTRRKRRRYPNYRTKKKKTERTTTRRGYYKPTYIVIRISIGRPD